MLASSLDSAKNGGGEGQRGGGADVGGRCSSQGNGLQTCEAAEEACKRPNEIYSCVCASVYRIIAKQSCQALHRVRKKEICIHLQFDLLSIYCIYMHSFIVKLQFT